MPDRVRAAVLGSPIGHSLSPPIHRAAYRLLGLTDWRYDAAEVDEGGLAAFVATCDDEWAGLSLTMPLKRAVLPLLTERSSTVEVTGAANTVVFSAIGLSGHNTDVAGMIGALSEAGVLATRQPLVLGGGATAASTLVAVSRLGADAVTVALRRPTAARPLHELGDRIGLRVDVVSWDPASVVRVMRAADLVVATSPAGSSDDIAAALAGQRVTPTAALFDVLYAPWPTDLAAAWQAAGGRVLGGLDLLVHQAVRQVELMTGCGRSHRADLVAAMRSAGVLGLKTQEGRAERKEGSPPVGNAVAPADL